MLAGDVPVENPHHGSVLCDPSEKDLDEIEMALPCGVNGRCGHGSGKDLKVLAGGKTKLTYHVAAVLPGYVTRPVNVAMSPHQLSTQSRALSAGHVCLVSSCVPNAWTQRITRILHWDSK